MNRRRRDPTHKYSLLDNEPSSRLPVILLVDASTSMRLSRGAQGVGKVFESDGQSWQEARGGEPSLQAQLQEAVQGFAREIQKDPRAKASVELAVVTFGDKPTLTRQFEPVGPDLERFHYEANADGTGLGAGLKVAMTLIEARLHDYRSRGTKHYHPQLIVMSDGIESDPHLCQEIVPHVLRRVADDKLICLPFLLGDAREAPAMRGLTPKGTLLRVQGVQLTELFQWLSRSSAQVSRSTAGGSDAPTQDQIVSDLRQNCRSLSDI